MTKIASFVSTGRKERITDLVKTVPVKISVNIMESGCYSINQNGLTVQKKSSRILACVATFISGLNITRTVIQMRFQIPVGTLCGRI